MEVMGSEKRTLERPESVAEFPLGRVQLLAEDNGIGRVNGRSGSSGATACGVFRSM